MARPSELSVSLTTPSPAPMIPLPAKSSFHKSNSEEEMVRFLFTYISLDIYVSMVSSSHAVCAKGLFIAMISTIVETDKPELEIRPALDLLGDILEMFV